MVNWANLLDEINNLQVKITRDKIFKNDSKDFLTHVKKCLKLNKTSDWDYILASEDILEDTNLAIKNALEFGLSGPTKHNDTGEKYLRLYGILNATYLQQQSILNLYKLFQCENSSEVKKKIEALEICNVRHKLGAHSVNYLDKSTKNIQTYVPVRISINDFNFDYHNTIQNESFSVDLIELINDHLKLMCNLYYEVLLKTINTIYKSNPEKISKLMESVKPIKAQVNGSMIVKIGNSNDYIEFSPVPNDNN